MTDRELLQQALDALELLARYENPATKVQVRKPRDGGHIVTVYPHKVATEAAAPLRERLARGEQEPFCYMTAQYEVALFESPPKPGSEWADFFPVYTVPQPAKKQEPVAAANALRHAAQVVQLYDDACMNDYYMLDSSDCENILNALAEYYEAGYTAPPQRERGQHE